MPSVLIKRLASSLSSLPSDFRRSKLFPICALVMWPASHAAAQTEESSADLEVQKSADSGAISKPPEEAPGSDDEEIQVDSSTSPEADPQRAPSAPVPSKPPQASAEETKSPTEVQPIPSNGEASLPPATPIAEAPVDDGEKRADLARTESPAAVEHSKAESHTELEREGSNYRRRLPSGFLVQGFVQVQYQGSQLSQDQLDPDGRPLNQDEFGVRRARIRLDHGWDYAFATLEVDAGTLGGASLRLRRAEASLFYRGNAPVSDTPWAVLTAGVTDLPFGGELGESQRDRLFMEQSIASRALFPTPADLGVKLWGAYDALEYGVALVNGEPTDESGFPTDRNSHKDVVGRVGFQSALGESADLGGGASFYVGQGFSPGTPGSKDSLTWVDTNNNGVVDAGEVLGTTGSSPIASKNFDRWAAALDLHGRIQTGLGITKLGGEFYLASNLDRAVFPSDPVTVGGDALALGASFFAMQQIARHVLVGVRAAYYDPNANLTEERAGVFHLNDQSFVEISPSVGLSMNRARLSFQYDLLLDHLGRDEEGVPTDTKNDRYTLRLQVDL
jgi:hypothetical protein